MVLNMVKLFGKPVRVNKASSDKRALDVGANLFVGNLDPDVDEKVLFDTFSAFGVIVNTPKVMRDPDTGVHPVPPSDQQCMLWRFLTQSRPAHSCLPLCCMRGGAMAPSSLCNALRLDGIALCAHGHHTGLILGSVGCMTALASLLWPALLSCAQLRPSVL